MSLKSDILDVKEWVDGHCVVMQPRQGELLSGNLNALESCADQAEELETLVKQAHQLLSGEWEPDDIDRHKFLVRLERAIS